MDAKIEIDGEYTVVVDTRKTREIVRAAGYGRRSKHVCNKRFPNRNERMEEITLVMAHCRGASPSASWMLREGAPLGLVRCMYEDVLFFGEQRQKEQLRHQIIGLHEPYRFEGDDRGWRLYLGTWYGDARSLGLVCDDGPMPHVTRFLFRKVQP